MKVTRKVQVRATRSLEKWSDGTLRVVTRTEDGKFVDQLSLAQVL